MLCSLIICIFVILATAELLNAFPVGINLQPVGNIGSFNGASFSGVDFETTATNVFVDLFKHCGPFYVKSTSDGGNSLGWVSGEYIAANIPFRKNDGYPALLPFTNKRNYHLAICDIGRGGRFVPAGNYSVTWSGDGNIDFPKQTGIKISQYSNLTRSCTITVGNLNADFSVRIIRTNPSDPVRDIKIIPAVYKSLPVGQIFTPSFLEVISKFDLIRFVGWQKIGYNVMKSWANRTVPSYYSQNTADGVSLEHMVDLVKATNIKSVWFSFPGRSTGYNSRALALLADSLPSNLTIYYELGSPETYGDGNRAAEALAFFDLVDSVFASRRSKGFVLKPTYSITLPQFISYANSYLQSAGMNRVKVFAISGAFGVSPDNSYEWDIKYSSYSTPQLLDEIRRGNLHVEMTFNRMRKTLLSINPDAEVVAYRGGPFLTTYSYGYRAGNSSIWGCVRSNLFPCTWANTKYSFANRAEVNAAAYWMNRNATLEQTLEDKLNEIQRNPGMEAIFLDMLERWNRINGSVYVGPSMVTQSRRCPNGGPNCGNLGMFESPQLADPNSMPKYHSLVAYKAGVRSTLPFTSADLPNPPPPSTTLNCKWGTFHKDKCVCFNGYSGALCTVRVPKPNDCTNDTGINLSGLADWSAEWTYVDIFKSSRAWISQDFSLNSPWSTGSRQNLSQHDYPRDLLPNQKLGAMMIRDLRNHVRPGVYVVLYDGDGILTFSMDVQGVKLDIGRIEVTIMPSTGLNNGLFLVIERTNPLDPIRNIRVIRPGFEESHKEFPFHPLYLESLKNYKVLRFMDLANTNGVSKGKWEERSTQLTRSFSSTVPGSMSMPIEDMVLLANTIGASPWFNMPHLCTDDFVLQYATLVKATLRPDVKIYIEYSNEVWGTLFSGGQYAQQQGIRNGYSTDGTRARFTFYIIRSSEIFSIWKSVFQDQVDRLEFIWASQHVQPYVTQLYLEIASAYKVAVPATAIAIAPYFGVYDKNKDKNIDVFMNSTLPKDIPSIGILVRGHKAHARRYNMSVVLYEGGIGLAGSNTAADLAIVANRDSRMSGIYVSYFEELRRSGIELMMQFTSAGLHTTSMTWGLIESTDQNPLTAPKYLGLQQYIQKYSSCDAESISKSSKSYTCPADCSSSGLCVSQDVCECYYGSSGPACENAIYTEHKDMCGYYCGFAQGDCLPDRVVGNERYWKCKCLPGYYGSECQLFDCANKCSYNGKCLDVNLCSCYPGFKGVSCDIDCGCNGHGSCATNSTSIATDLSLPTCHCDVGWKWSTTLKSCQPDCQSGSCAGPSDSLCPSSCNFGQCFDGKCKCWAGYTGSECNIPTLRPNSNSKAGTTLSGIAYYSHEWTFVDAMKMSSAWISLDEPGTNYNISYWDNGKPLDLRPDGYLASLAPRQIAGKLLLRDMHRHAPSGRYVCLYDGDGELDFIFDAKTVQIGKGRVEFEFFPTFTDGCTASYCGDNGILLRLLKTNPANPVRNIRVIMPGFEATYKKNPFHPWFIKNIRGYSVLRFMGWQATNNNEETVWSNRTLPNYDTQSSSVAIEHMIELSNIIGAAPWFCIGHKNDDDYVLKFAQLVKANLRSDIEIYLEYSNEVWNTLFSQGSYSQNQGLKLGLHSNAYTAGYRFYAQRSVEIFNIWKSVFTGTGVKIHYILSTQTVSSSVTNSILSWKNASSFATALGVAPYFGCGDAGSHHNAAKIALLSETQLLQRCIDALRNESLVIKSISVVAAKYNLPLVTYESGQSLVEYNVMAYGNGETAGLTSLFTNANRNPMMQDVYDRYISILTEVNLIGKYPLIHFTSCGWFTKYGSWGIIEYTGQPIAMAPKYLAIRKLFNYTTSFNKIYTNNMAMEGDIDGGDVSYSGYPAIVSPRSGDVWVTGLSNIHKIRWDTVGSGSSSLTLSIHIWRTGVESVELSAATYVQLVTDNVQQKMGSLNVALPESLIVDGTQNYFLEFRDSSSFDRPSNYSSLFAIESSYHFDNISHICCNSNYIPVTSSSKCLKADTGEFLNPILQNSSWGLIREPKINTCLVGTVLSSSIWASYTCSMDTNGCRNFRAALHSNVGRMGSGKPVTDCVALQSAFPQQPSSSTQWTLSYSEEISSLGCYNQGRLDYTVQTDSCSIPSPEHICMKTQTPSKKPTFIPSIRPSSRQPTRFPSGHPSFKPSRAPSRCPTLAMTSMPSMTPTRSPTRLPSRSPSYYPTRSPSRPPSRAPATRVPSQFPSRSPTRAPTLLPSRIPSRIPTRAPTLNPSRVPTRSPTRASSRSPSRSPTRVPSRISSQSPSRIPSRAPSRNPSLIPSILPTRVPSRTPSITPSRLPSRIPSRTPSRNPTRAPV